MAKIIYIERQLRAGKTPQQIGGEEIGRGAVKAAYKVGPYIVKQNAQQGLAGKAEKIPHKALRKWTVRTYKAGDYIIQEQVTPINRLRREGKPELTPEQESEYQQMRRIGEKHEVYDLHEGNVGVREDVYLAIFDW